MEAFIILRATGETSQHYPCYNAKWPGHRKPYSTRHRRRHRAVLTKPWNICVRRPQGQLCMGKLLIHGGLSKSEDCGKVSPTLVWLEVTVSEILPLQAEFFRSRPALFMKSHLKGKNEREGDWIKDETVGVTPVIQSLFWEEWKQGHWWPGTQWGWCYLGTSSEHSENLDWMPVPTAWAATHSSCVRLTQAASSWLLYETHCSMKLF